MPQRPTWWVLAIGLCLLVPACRLAPATDTQKPTTPGQKTAVDGSGPAPVAGPAVGPGAAKTGADAGGEPTQDSVAPVTLLFAGDVHFQWGVTELQQRSGLLAPIERIAPVFHAADYRVLNLETSLTDRGEPAADKSYIFSAPEQNVGVLAALRLDLAVLGNNHSMDMGVAGYRRTVEVLRRAGIGSVGVGENTTQAASPHFAVVRGMRVAVVSFCSVGEGLNFSTGRAPGVANPEINDLRPYIRAARADADVVIVNAHWGMEYYSRPTPRQIALARGFIDAGADAVIGHHPHVPHGLEVYRGRFIFYSLGNFIFGSVNELQTHNILVRLDVDPVTKKIPRARILPILGRFQNEGHRPRLLEATESREFWQDFVVMTGDLAPTGAERLSLQADGSGVVDLSPPPAPTPQKAAPHKAVPEKPAQKQSPGP